MRRAVAFDRAIDGPVRVADCIAVVVDRTERIGRPKRIGISSERTAAELEPSGLTEPQLSG